MSFLKKRPISKKTSFSKRNEENFMTNFPVNSIKDRTQFSIRQRRITFAVIIEGNNGSKKRFNSELEAQSINKLFEPRTLEFIF